MNTAQDIVREIEKIERDAWADLFAAAPDDIRAKLDLETHRIGGALITISRAIDHIQFNHAIGLGVFEPATADAVGEAVAAFEKAGVKNWIVHFAEGAADFELAASPHGLVAHPRTWAKFARDNAPAAAKTDFVVREVGAGEAPAFGQTAARGFGMPPIMGEWLSALPGRAKWKCFAAFDGDAPVGAGAVFIDGPNAWVGIGATLEASRGRGAQPAILAARINAAREAGVSLITTETGIPQAGEAGPSFKNIQRAGFQIAYPRPNLTRAQR